MCVLFLQVDENELRMMTTDGAYWKSPNFSSLASLLNDLVRKTCEEVQKPVGAIAPTSMSYFFNNIAHSFETQSCQCQLNNHQQLLLYKCIHTCIHVHSICVIIAYTLLSVPFI